LLARANAEIILLSPVHVEETFKKLRPADAVEKGGDAAGTSYVG